MMLLQVGLSGLKQTEFGFCNRQGRHQHISTVGKKRSEGGVRIKLVTEYQIQPTTSTFTTTRQYPSTGCCRLVTVSLWRWSTPLHFLFFAWRTKKRGRRLPSLWALSFNNVWEKLDGFGGSKQHQRIIRHRYQYDDLTETCDVVEREAGVDIFFIHRKRQRYFLH